MNGSTVYDPDVQMFREATREPKPETIRFLRWMADHGRFGNLPAGPPSGALVEVLDWALATQIRM